MEQVVGKKVVVLVALPYLGHLNPMLQLGTLLLSKGFSITVIHTQTNPPNPSTHPLFQFLPMPDSTVSHTESLDFVTQALSLNHKCEAPFREMVGNMLIHMIDIACIIYDGFMYFADHVAYHFKLRSIIFRPTSATNVLTYSLYPQLQHQGHVPLQDSMLRDLIPGLHPLIYKDLPIATFPNPNPYLQLISRVRGIGSSSAIIWNTVECLEQSSLTQVQQQHGVPVFSVGPLQTIAKAGNGSFIEEDTGCIKWLDKQTNNSVLYVSFGSVAIVNERELVEMAWGLANSNQPFLWVIRPGSVAGSEWIELLPDGFRDGIGESGYIVKWAPQREVLAHPAVGGFWSHCGWNSTLESISQGAPLICKPFFGDQRINARCLSHVWKVGILLENALVRDEIEKAVRMLMVDKEGDDMRMRSKDLKQEIESNIREGGSSYSSLSKFVEFIM